MRLGMRVSGTIVILTVTAGLTSTALGAPASAPANGRPTPTANRSATCSSASWTRISQPLDYGAFADLIRVGDQLHAVWVDYSGSGHALATRTLGSNAKPVSGVVNPVEGWLDIEDTPSLLEYDGELMLAFAGGEESAVNYPARFTTSADGVDWALSSDTLSEGDAWWDGSQQDVINGAGEPMWAMTEPTNNHVTLHRGINDGATDTADFESSATAGSTATLVTLANDRGTGDVYAGWFSDGTGTANRGLFVQRVWPQPNGTLLHAPDSSVPGNFLVDQGGFLSERAGGGVFAAFRVKAQSKIRILQVGESKSLDVQTSGSVDNVTLTPGAGGRLWLSWFDDGKYLAAARTNPAVTKIGAVRRVRVPTGCLIDSIAPEGSAGPLDVVVDISTRNFTQFSFWSKHVLPALGVTSRPYSLRAGLVHITVTDAGKRIKHAKVQFRGAVHFTNARGQTTFRVRPNVPHGSYTPWVTKPGYARSPGDQVLVR